MSTTSKISKSKNKSDESLSNAIGVIGLLLLIIGVIWGNPDKKTQVLSPKLKSLLSDDDNANALLDAIEKEKSGIDKTPEFNMNGKRYKIERAGKNQFQEA